MLQEIEHQLNSADISCEEKEEIAFVLAQSKKSVEAWKCHILRSINQDNARLDILHALDDHSVLVVLDWAMKFNPRKFRESQADWFGKRGMSWHISVAMRMLSDQSTVETLTLIHLFQKSNQDSLCELAIIDDVLRN